MAPNSEYLNIIPNGRYESLDGEFDIFSSLLPSSNGNFVITDRENMTIDTEFIDDGNIYNTEFNLEEIIDEPNAQKGFILKKIKSEHETVEFIFTGWHSAH